MIVMNILQSKSQGTMMGDWENFAMDALEVDVFLFQPLIKFVL